MVLKLGRREDLFEIEFGFENNSENVEMEWWIKDLLDFEIVRNLRQSIFVLEGLNLKSSFDD